jgi:hypothetical protein
MLLDRAADTFLARRAGAEGWLVKPLDSLRLRRAATTILQGGAVYEGLPPGQILPTDEVPPDGEGPDDASGEPTGGDGSPAAEGVGDESARGDEVTAG